MADEDYIKQKKLNKFNYHYEFCERQELRKMYEEEIDKVEQLECENEKLKNGYMRLKENALKYDDKETPLTLNYIFDGYADGYPVYDTVQCPHCNMTFETEEVENKQYKYCPYCGQRWNEIKLDWSIEEEK